VTWDEVADGCFRRRYSSLDLNVGVVAGSEGLLVVDTRSSHREADELRAELARLSRAPVVAVVNTHAHFDHCYGNGRFAGIPMWGHRTVPGYLAERGEAVRTGLAEEGPEWAQDMADVVITPPDRLVGDVRTLDLGDRQVTLRHFGRGHTGGDLVVIVPDAAVVYAGDLAEESAPPGYGDDSFPLDWPDTLAGLLHTAQDTAAATVVPGHGDVVDRAFVVAQQVAITRVADTIRALHAAGVPVEDATLEGDWPYPHAAVRNAVLRGYLQLDGRL
jgi:glyoxylase-like metal-dependent hydrolase (beta-lactamase superfamily II)